MLKEIKNKLRNYFEKNTVGYTFLFFAQGGFVAENIYWSHMMKSDYGKTPVHSFMGYFNFGSFLLNYFLPTIFLLGALLTFKYPTKDPAKKAFLFILHLLFCTIILTSGMMGYGQ